MFDSQLCSQPQKHEFPQPPISHLNPFCGTLFKYKIGLIIPSLMHFTRVLGGVRDNVYENCSRKCRPSRAGGTGFPVLIHTWLLANLPVHWLHCALLIVSRESHGRKKLIDRIPFPREPPGWPSERTWEERHPSGFCVGRVAWTRIAVRQLSQLGGFAPSLSP